jgi:hypothetical protein
MCDWLRRGKGGALHFFSEINLNLKPHYKESTRTGLISSFLTVLLFTIPPAGRFPGHFRKRRNEDKRSLSGPRDQEFSATTV